MRGYSALAAGRGQLRIDTAKFSGDNKTVTMFDVGGNEVKRVQGRKLVKIPGTMQLIRTDF